MKNIRYFGISLLLVVAFIIPIHVQAQASGYPDFEVVESIPAGTVLDNADVRNAPDVWVSMINGAKKSLDIEQFYISNLKGEALEPVIASVIDAAKRGVTVRIVADAKFYKTYPETYDSLTKMNGISGRLIDFGKLTGGVEHAKFFIVDAEEIFLGSQNFDWRAMNHIHEIGVRIHNTEAVKAYKDIFNLDWQLAEKNDPALISSLVKPAHYNFPVTINEDGGDVLAYEPTASPKGLLPDSTMWDETHIVKLIDDAKADVDVQVLTYSPSERGGGMYTVLDDAFRRAAGRGVKVKLIVSDWSVGKPFSEYLKSLSKVPNIEVKYTSIPDFAEKYVSFGRVEHCKYLVVDGKHCWIGTANWEKGYFYTLRNLGVVVHNPKIASLMNRIFMKGWNGPYAKPVTADGEYTSRKHGEVQGK